MGFVTSIAKRRPLLAALALAAGSVPAAAQFSDSYNFLKAVRDRDVTKATELAQKAGAPVNARDYTTGETPLIVVTKGRDLPWLGFLLQNGAKTELKDGQGNTPLTTAAQIGWIEGARILLQVGASPNLANNRGETPLILAVQQRDPAMVRLLLAQGADPKISDRVAGKSARDYAAEDNRAAAILKLLDDAKPKAAVTGPVRP